MKPRWLVGALLFVSAQAHASTDADFWKWFAANQAQVAKATRADAPIANQLAQKLHAVDPRLTFALGVTQTPKDLVISADGLKELFPVVQKLVAAAPKIPGWKVTAFRPRSDGISVELGGIRLSADSMMVVAQDRGEKLDVTIHVSGGLKLDDQVKGAVFLLLDSLLGEYDVETRIAGIDIVGGAPPKTAVPFSKLRELVDAKKKTAR